MKFASEAPSLIEHFEGNQAQINKSIEARETLSGRLASDAQSNTLQKSIDAGIPIERAHEAGLMKSEDALNECLKNNHGEQFHSDADKEVVAFLTQSAKIDTAVMPHDDGKQLHGFPIARSNSAVVDALETVCKSGEPTPCPVPTPASPDAEKPAPKAEEPQPKKEEPVKKSDVEVALDEVCKSGF